MTEFGQAWNPPLTETLPREDPDFNLGLIEPTAVLGRIVDGEPIPDLETDFLAVGGDQGFTAMGIQIVHDQMNGLGWAILHGQMKQHLGKFKSRSIGGREGKMSAGFGLYRAENVGGPATFVLTVLASLPAWLRGAGGSNVSMERNGLFIQANYRLRGVVWLFIRLQHVLHLGDVFGVEFGHAPHFFPATA